MHVPPLTLASILLISEESESHDNDDIDDDLLSLSSPDLPHLSPLLGLSSSAHHSNEDLQLAYKPRPGISPLPSLAEPLSTNQ